MPSETSPLQPEHWNLITQITPQLNRDQSLWLSGYFAGVAGIGGAGSAGSAIALTAPAAIAKPKLTILYGTESGNAEKLAFSMGKTANKSNFKATVTSMADAKPADLAKAENLLIVISTWGEGDPPDNATSYYEAFMSDAMPRLEGVRYSVCGLGDTSYSDFCKMGNDFDSRLEKLGAERIHPRADCDVDYSETFNHWFKGVMMALDKVAASCYNDAPQARLMSSPAASPYGKENPYTTQLLEKIVLNGTGSAKEVLHIELALDPAHISYEAGDALGILPVNRAAVIEAVLQATGLSSSAPLGEKTLGEALAHDFDITTLAPLIVDKYNAVVQNPELKKLLDEPDKAALKEWIEGRHLIDLLDTYPYQGWTAETFTSILRKLAPRLYSIASSPKAHDDQVHLTVAAVRYNTHGRDRIGVCSCYLADEVQVGDSVRVYLHQNNNFRLPPSDDTPILMIGPGTGIAPFRAFIEERSARGAKGKSWLFFGDQHYSYDFLYQLEWIEHMESGALTELSLAFSRDQPEKVYVQHRLLERGAEVYQWMEDGAYIYVCGDASRMAKDVQQALIQIISEHGGKTPEEAKAYLDSLRKAKRYQRDVY